MNNKVLQSLQSFGYTDREIAVYLAALYTGTAPASKIGTQADLNRVTTYGVLQKLLEKGLFTTTCIQDIQHFTPVDPALLWERQQQKLQQFEKTLPFLSSLASGSDLHPAVQLFEGLSGLKKAYLQTLKAKTEILNYANSRTIRDHWPSYDEEYVSIRAERKIFLKGISPDDALGKKVQAADGQFYRETRLLPQKLFWVENEIKIFDDKVLISSFEPRAFAILIQSQAVADTQRQIFNLAWGK